VTRASIRSLPLLALLTVALPLGAVAATAVTGTAHPKTRTARPARASAPAKHSVMLPAPHEPRFYLSWNAPWGTPRATAAITAPCGDSTVVDTLYLSFDPGKDAPAFVGASATLSIEAAQGSELPERWKRGTATASPVRVTFESDPDRGFLTPWSAQGAGAPHYDVVGDRGRLRLIYAIAPNTGPGAEGGKLSGFGRVLVRRSPAGADGCATPLCIEVTGGELAYGYDEAHNVEAGERRVTINSPDGTVCAPTKSPFGAQPWKPHTGK